MESKKRSKSSRHSSPSSSSSSSRTASSSSSSSDDSSSSTDSDSDSSSSDDDEMPITTNGRSSASASAPAPSRHPLPPLIHADPASYIDSNTHTEGMCMSQISREPLQLFMTGSGQGYVKGKGGMYMPTSKDAEERKRYKWKYSVEKIQRKMDAAKKKHRPSLKMHDWQRYNYASIFNGYRHDSYLSMPPTSHPTTYAHLKSASLAAKQSATPPSAPCTCEVAKNTTHHPHINFHLPTSIANQDQLASPTSSKTAPPSPSTSHHSSCPQRTRQTTPTSHYSCPAASLPSWTATGIERVHWRDLTLERFIRDYESPQRPVIILGLADAWSSRNWDSASLQRSKYKNSTFKCGEDDDGYSIKVKLKHFLQYMHQQKDDSPMYIFDCSFDENSVTKDILTEFEVPMYFRDDLFSLVGSRRRPPHRWFLVGPERSGSSLHIDPLATSAWNTLLTGAKRWVLFQPGTLRKYCKNDFFKQKGEDNEAITYFMRALPRIRAQEEAKEGGSDTGLCEFVQYPGETVFVPGGWWHSVLNLEDSLAVTQNFVSRTNFEDVWRQTRKGRKHMAKRWLTQLEIHHPDLAARAHKIDKEDNFVFKFTDPRQRAAKKSSSKKKSHKKHKSSMGMSSRGDRCDSHRSESASSHTNGHTNGNGHADTQMRD